MKLNIHPCSRVMYQAANRLAHNYWSNFINAALVPVDYTRAKEIPTSIAISGILERKSENLRILDISSPQILTLSLCSYSPEWRTVYINPHQPELEDMKKKSAILSLENITIADGNIADKRSISGLKTFDYIFSCSVFEHIHPEFGGDVLAARNISELLNPGGKFIFSVPYYREKFNEYVDGDVYGVKNPSGAPTFFQRFYDEASLHEQIVNPTGLDVVGKKYIGERFYYENNIKKRMAFLVGFGRRAYALGRFFNKISDIFMEFSEDYRSLKKPYLAIYCLEKK